MTASAIISIAFSIAERVGPLRQRSLEIGDATCGVPIARIRNVHLIPVPLALGRLSTAQIHPLFRGVLTRVQKSSFKSKSEYEAVVRGIAMDGRNSSHRECSILKPRSALPNGCQPVKRVTIVPPIHGDLLTTASYSDFDLKLDFWTEKNLDIAGVSALYSIPRAQSDWYE